MNVLIVEDETILAMNMQMELASLGYKVVGIADSAERALEIAERSRPELVLMDIVIHGNTNGIELAQIISEMYPEVKVIYMTAHSDEATLERARLTSHVGFLNKPFETYQLERLLRQIEER